MGASDVAVRDELGVGRVRYLKGRAKCVQHQAKVKQDCAFVKAGGCRFEVVVDAADDDGQNHLADYTGDDRGQIVAHPYEAPGETHLDLSAKRDGVGSSAKPSLVSRAR